MRIDAKARLYLLVALGALAIVIALIVFSPSRSRLSVVLVTIDSCRADHLSCYGYRYPTTPNIDAIAARGVRFDRAYCNAVDTCGSHCSLFTSLLPLVHGAANGVPLRESFLTLAEILRGESYATAGFVSGLPLKRELSGLAQGFDLYDDGFEGVERSGGETMELAIQWLERNDGGRFFLFIHLYDPHGGYSPPARFLVHHRRGDGAGYVPRELDLNMIPARVRVDDIVDANYYIDAYDGEISYADDQVGLLWDKIKDMGLSKEVMLVITSDHGESLTEHGVYFGHGESVYEPSLRVPLVVYSPSLSGGRTAGDLAQAVDIMPTVLEACGIEAAINMQGRNLLPPGEEKEGERPVFSKTTRELTQRLVEPLSDFTDKTALMTRRWKLIVTKGEQDAELYDLAADPAEKKDLFGERKALAAEMREKMIAVARGSVFYSQEKGAEKAVDLEEHERILRSLGYLQ